MTGLRELEPTQGAGAPGAGKGRSRHSERRSTLDRCLAGGRSGGVAPDGAGEVGGEEGTEGGGGPRTAASPVSGAGSGERGRLGEGPAGTAPAGTAPGGSDSRAGSGVRP